MMAETINTNVLLGEASYIRKAIWSKGLFVKILGEMNEIE